MTYPNYDAIQSFYNLNLWTKDMVGEGVRCKVITAGQYKTIVGEEYQAPAASTAPVGTSTVASDSTAATSGTASVTPTA
jgi:hypothetical protein